MRLLLAVLLLLALAAPAQAAVPDNVTWSEHYIETPGEPTLHVDVLQPKGMETSKTPVIVNIGPYNGHGGATTPEPGTNGPPVIYSEFYEEGGAVDRGYAIVQADLRGFGGSQGCNDFGGKGEQLDTKRIVEWVAAQPWSTGKVGLWGMSYDGWTQVMALDEKPQGLAAAIIQAPVLNGYKALYQNGVHYGPAWWLTPALYQEIDAIPPTPTDSPEYWLNWAQGTRPDCYAQNIALQNATDDPAAEFWKERDLPGARGSEVPVLWAHGFMDINTKPDNFLPVWTTLKGPARAWFGQFAHNRASKKNHVIGRDGFLAESLDFLDRYVKGLPVPAVDAAPRTVIQDGDGRWRGEAQWPPADAGLHAMPSGTGVVVDAPNNSGEGTGTDRGVGIWSFTPPLAYEARIAGVPRVRLNVSTSSPRGHIFALLYDIDGTTAKLITRAAHVVLSGDSTVEFDLYPQDWRLAPGHRLGLLVAGSDLDLWVPPHTNAEIDVSRGELSIPFLRHERTQFLDGDVANAQGSLQTFEVAESALEAATVAWDAPAAMVSPPPAVTAPTPPAARPRAARLRVSVSRRGRVLTARVRGVNGRVRLTVRGQGFRSTRTVRARRGLAVARLRVRRAGAYTVSARTTGRRPLSGSRRVRVR